MHLNVRGRLTVFATCALVAEKWELTQFLLLHSEKYKYTKKIHSDSFTVVNGHVSSVKNNF